MDYNKLLLDELRLVPFIKTIIREVDNSKSLQP